MAWGEELGKSCFANGGQNLGERQGSHANSQATKLEWRVVGPQGKGFAEEEGGRTTISLAEAFHPFFGLSSTWSSRRKNPTWGAGGMNHQGLMARRSFQRLWSQLDVTVAVGLAVAVPTLVWGAEPPSAA